MPNERRDYTAFVPNGDNRRETAILLVGTADEYGIDQRDIKAVPGGFRITDAMADALGGADEPTESEAEQEARQEAEAEARTKAEAEAAANAPKTSGRRTAKNDS